ncbi:Pol protein [Phytophthora palmivora]|uniref:Pol protein n=1 Tax=Phytophthora palmivora TaxID=4796 RepID=A0A2P4X8N8_9STRA|nr:Pol protein [Phytophthora palmivora]
MVDVNAPYPSNPGSRRLPNGIIPVHDKELLVIDTPLGSKPFVIYPDHAFLWTDTNSPHLSQRVARWLLFFSEYNFRVEYKPDKLNVLANALSRRSDYELAGHDRSVRSDIPFIARFPLPRWSCDPALYLPPVDTQSVTTSMASSEDVTEFGDSKDANYYPSVTSYNFASPCKF